MAYIQNSQMNNTYTTKHEADLIKRSIIIRDNWFKNGDNAPFTTLLRGKGRVEKETNQKFEWLELRPNKIQFLVSPFNTSATSLTVVNLSGSTVDFLAVGSILWVPQTNEQMRVTAIAGTTLTVTRAYGFQYGTETQFVAAAAVADAKTDSASSNDAVKIINMSRAFEEGSKAPKGTTMVKTSGFNYSQIFRDTINITRNDLLTPRWGDDTAGVGDKRKRRRQEVFKLHQQSIEHQLLFGTPYKDLTGDTPRYLTGGILHFIKSNTIQIASANDFGPHSIDDVMSRLCDYGATGDKVVVAGSGFINRLNQNAIKVFGDGSGSPTQKEYGVNITKIGTAYGNVSIVYNPVLSVVKPNMGIFLDMSNIYLHVIQDTKLDMNIQIEGYDGVIDTYLTDLGLEVANEERHATLELNW